MAIAQPQNPSQDRRAAWSQMAGTPVESADDLYQTKRQTTGLDNYSYKPKQGMMKAFFQGLPNDPEYQPSFGEAFAAGTTEFVRSGAEVATELLSDNRKDARASIEELRKTDPEFADELEMSTIGKKPTNTQLALRGTAAIGEGVLTVLPFFKAGRLAIGAGEAALISKMGKAGKVLAGSPSLKTIFTGSLYGSIYGGTYGVHTGEEFNDVLKDMAWGGAAGGAIGGLGVFAGKAYTTTKAGGKALGRLAVSVTPDWVKQGKFIPEFLRSTGYRLEQGFGDVGKNFMKMYNSAVKLGSLDLGRIHLSMVDNGLIEPPPMAKKYFKNTEYVGDNVELMNEYNRILRGKGMYADPIVRADKIASDPRLTYLDELRKWYGTTAQREGVVENLLDLDTYLPKYTQEILLKNTLAEKLAGATSQAEREAIYASNNDIVREMVENSVYNEKAFRSLEESYKAYYDYVDFVEQGGRVKLNDNSFLRKMVMDGQASTIEQAAGKLLEDMKWRKKSLTPMATSLDFKRNVDLPWYDPNPARVMPSYAVDAAMRLSMAKTFGKNDEAISQMIGSISKDPLRGAKAVSDAKKFERLVRTVTGQIERNPQAERVSQFLRALNVPKLVFAQVLNIGQNLNYLLATDFNSTMHGLQVIFREDSMRKALESGVLVNNLLREVFEYSTGGGRLADKILKYSGFTWTEMFNRATGSVVAERWAVRNYSKFMKELGLSELGEAEQKSVIKMLNDKKMLEKRVLDTAIETQKQFFEEYQKIFPDDNFIASAGNIGVARKRLAKLESDVMPKIEKLQKARQVLQDELVNESMPLTDQYVDDLQQSIEMLRGAISQSSEGSTALPIEAIVPEKVYSGEDVGAAIDGAVNLRREQLASILAKLEDKFTEVRAMGTMGGDVPKPIVPKDPTSQDLGQYLAGVNGDIKAIDSAIISLQNELADKSSLLEGVIDSYQIAEKRAAKDFPEGLAYDKFIEKRRTETDKRLLSKQAERITKKNGGVTITLDGDAPQNGYVFSKRKDTEAVKPLEEWVAEDVDSYVDKYFDLLSEDNAHLGIWVDDGNVYMDVSTVLPDKTQALIEARNADQIGIFDLNNFETLYTKDYEKIISDALNQGQVQGAAQSGAEGAAIEKGVAQKGQQIKYEKAESASKLTIEEQALRELGIDVDEAKIRGFLAPDDFVYAAQALVDKTQFSGRASELPAMASTPMGKIIFQFKTFAYQQTKFMAKELKRDAVSNPKRFMRSLLILGTVFPMTGEVLGDIRSLMTQEKRPTRAFDRYMSDLAGAGAWGLAFDFWNSAEHGKTMEFFAGVTASDAVKYLEQVGVPLVKGEGGKAMRNFTKQALRQTGVGRPFVNMAFPSTTPGKTMASSILDWSMDE